MAEERAAKQAAGKRTAGRRLAGAADPSAAVDGEQEQQAATAAAAAQAGPQTQPGGEPQEEPVQAGAAASVTSVTAKSTESPRARLTRNWQELLQEIRVAQAGVQILFAFLLTLPFTQRWESITSFQRGVYLTTLLLVAVASALLVAPVAYHRLVFRRGARAELVEAANILALAGLLALALAINGAVLLVVDVLLGTAATVVIVTGTGLTFLALWGVLPVLSRRRRVRDSPLGAAPLRSPPPTRPRR